MGLQREAETRAWLARGYIKAWAPHMKHQGPGFSHCWEQLGSEYRAESQEGEAALSVPEALDQPAMK